MRLLTCWIEHPIRKLDQTYSYFSDTYVEQGVRVVVPFGKHQVVGFVATCTNEDVDEEKVVEESGYALKKVLEVLDEEPLITNELYDLALWMKEQTLSTTIKCFQAMLPAKVKPTSNHQKVVQEKWVKISSEEVELTPKQLQAYLFLQQKKEMEYKEFRKAYPNQARALIDKGAVICYEKEKEASLKETTIVNASYPLTKLQQQAMDEIENSHDDVYLLKGVTGSGKTEVYLQLAQKAIEQGKQVLLLVPEISLTPQMIERVFERFGNALAIYHSGLNNQEKYEQYRKVYLGKAKIVVGTRSAVFLPFQNLGLIVLDEEHDASYKQENQPAYHCRDVAIYRGKYHHCKVVLGSATPSLDSYARALKKVYHLVTMNERINQVMPSIEIVDMKENLKQGGSAILSNSLITKIETRLEHNEQVILLLNRRGYHTLLKCRRCQEILKCPHCDLAMSYHSSKKKMVCHTCGYEMYVPKQCPNCGSYEGFMTSGFGTEKLEDEVKNKFPNAKVLRMDADTTSRKNSHETILKTFASHKADILLGTQMIAKGLDFPNVTLVGILNGDEGLNRTDFRSCETTFDLLMQASGRSGRSNKTGQVVIQVYDPSHYAVVCAKNQDYDAFFAREMQFRKLGQYPPYTYLISLTISGYQQREVDSLTLRIQANLQGNFKVIGSIPLLKIKDQVRNRIILKGKNLDEMRTVVKKLLQESEIDTSKLKIDVNPFVLD